ncbi:MCE family protein [uncultured Jatrophihabitans sp.]|uniref:MCE family protein n=1 Tax=uncultured Jatrophihabitans sp. TaxID=1610747 RepID=UPI0035CB0F6A
MLRRSTKIQLLLFVVITLLGVSYVSAEYVGLSKYVTGDNGCTITADFPDSGGIFSNAEVTYRGVTVGKVGALKLIKNGVRVNLQLDNCESPKIPASSSATIANRSVVGEQYVNLVPPGKGAGSDVRAGSNIPMSRNHIPLATQTLLGNLDSLVKSVNLNNLRTTVTELGKAVGGRGPDLGRLLDATNSLLQTATQSQNENAAIALINDSAPVLQTQLDETGALDSWTKNLKLLSGQLKQSDPDIRRLLDNGPTDLNTVKNFVQANRTDIGVVLDNLSTLGNMFVAHLPGVEEVLELYPALAAGGASVINPDQNNPGHNTVRLADVLQLSQTPEDCGDPKQNKQGYNTVRRGPGDLSPIAPNTAARCTAPASSGTNIRGSAHVPGGDPVSVSGGDQSYPRVVTNNLKVGQPVTIGTSLIHPAHLGDASWLALVTDGLH